MQNNEPQSQSHNDLDNLDNLSDEQINELYDDVYIDSFNDSTIAYSAKNNCGWNYCA